MLLHVSPLTSIDLVAVAAVKLIGIRAPSAHEASAAIKARILQLQAEVCCCRVCVSTHDAAQESKHISGAVADIRASKYLVCWLDASST